jgi:hypothetical protein
MPARAAPATSFVRILDSSDIFTFRFARSYRHTEFAFIRRLDYCNSARCVIRCISGALCERSVGATPDDERSKPCDEARSSFVGRKVAHTTTDKKTSP